MNERVQRLEEKIAYLERHVVEQDKVMLEIGDRLAKLRLEVQSLRDRAPTGSAGGANAEDQSTTEERPPHY